MLSFPNCWHIDCSTFTASSLMIWKSSTGIPSPPLALFMSEWVSEVAQSCPTLCNPMDCSLPSSSVHGVFQAIVLEWIAISLSSGSSQPRDRTRVSGIVDRRFTVWATREALFIVMLSKAHLTMHSRMSGCRWMITPSWLSGSWRYFLYSSFYSGVIFHWDFPGGSDGKASVYNAGDSSSIPGLGRSPGEGNGNPLQYYCLENPMDRRAW